MEDGPQETSCIRFPFPLFPLSSFAMPLAYSTAVTRVNRVMAAEREWKALKAWLAAGEVGERPPCPNLEELDRLHGTRAARVDKKRARVQGLVQSHTAKRKGPTVQPPIETSTTAERHEPGSVLAQIDHPKRASYPRGEIGDLVRKALEQAPPEGLTPAAIGKSLERSPGACSWSIDKLVKSGEAVLVSEKPKRYRLA